MLAFIIVLQVLVALFLILVVLLQPGNKGGAGAALGGAGADSVFGARGANTFLSKLTLGAAVCFMVTNILLAYLSSSKGDRSVLDSLPAETFKKPAAAEAAQAEPAEDSKPVVEPEMLEEDSAPSVEGEE